VEVWLGAVAGRIGPQRLLVIAPRHPSRAGEIAAELAPRRVARRSGGEPIDAGTDVYLADTFGELGLFLRLAPLAFIGGGFDANLGGHNPLEAARLGVGLVSGYQVANHAEPFAEMVAVGAARLVGDARGLDAELCALLAEPARGQAMAAAAAAYAAGQQDQMDQALALIRPLLPAPAAVA